MKLNWKAVIPIGVWLVLWLGSVFFGPPAGLALNAWLYFALFAAVILGLILEPIPAAAIGLIGVGIAAALRYVNGDISCAKRCWRCCFAAHKRNCRRPAPRR